MLGGNILYLVKVYILFLLALIASSGPVTSQRTGLDLLGDKKSVEIPFSHSNGLLLIQVKMNGLPLTFMYDSGAENTILFKREIAQVLRLESNRRIRIIGSDLSNDIYGFIVHDVNFNLMEGVERYESIIVLEENVYKIQESTGHQIDGLFGGNFFRNTQLKIDYKKRRIIISHPVTAKFNLNGYTEIPTLFSEQKPYLKAEVTTFENQKKEILLLMDTGSSIPFILHTNVDSTLKAPRHLIRGNLGIGLSGNLIGLIGIIKKLEFGTFKFDELLTNFQDLDSSILEQKDIIRHGILGNDILKRFVVIIDYFNRKVYLKPTKRYNRAFKYDKSGLVILASGLDFNEYYVNAVLDDSPAEKAGIMKGDQIKTLQCIPVSFRSLGNIHRILKGRDGNKVRLAVKRGEKKIIFHFKLRDMLRDHLSQNDLNKPGFNADT